MRAPLDQVILGNRFGMRTHPITGDRTMHNGLDLPAPAGTPIRAAAAGVIAATGSNLNPVYGAGHWVTIRHPNGLTTAYWHMLRPCTLKAGTLVAEGQQIGLVGSTGASTGNHLHFEVRVHGVPQDPLEHITATRPAALHPVPIPLTSPDTLQEKNTMRIVAGQPSNRRVALGELTYQELRADHASHEAHIWESAPGSSAAGEPLVIADETLDLAIGQIQQRRAQLAAALRFHGA